MIRVQYSRREAGAGAVRKVQHWNGLNVYFVRGLAFKNNYVAHRPVRFKVRQLLSIHVVVVFLTLYNPSV